MSSGNYEYDALGQLISDESEGISGIEWRYGDKKIRSITRDDAASSNAEFVVQLLRKLYNQDFDTSNLYW